MSDYDDDSFVRRIWDWLFNYEQGWQKLALAAAVGTGLYYGAYYLTSGFCLSPECRAELAEMRAEWDAEWDAIMAESAAVRDMSTEERRAYHVAEWARIQQVQPISGPDCQTFLNYHVHFWGVENGYWILGDHVDGTATYDDIQHCFFDALQHLSTELLRHR